MDRQALLRKVEFFSGLSDSVLAELSRAFEVVRVPKGKLLFVEGARAEYLWAVAEGRVKLFKVSPSGREQTVIIVEPGETFAEIAALKGQSYPVFAKSLEDSLLLRAPGHRIEEIVRQNPAVALSMMGAMAEKLKHLTSLVEDLSLRDVPARLCRYILEASRGKEILVLAVSKAELARYLGTTPETLSRSLSRLSKLGVVEVRGSMIRILSRSRLEEMAESEVS